MSLTAGMRFVKSALRAEALELLPEGRKLKSGRMSPYFFNSALFNTGFELKELAKFYAKKIFYLEDQPDIIFGPAYKGTVLAPAIAMVLDDFNVEVGFASNRKEAKTYGEEGDLIGSGMKGAKVLIVDDVITTGKTKAEALEFVRSNGGEVIGVMVAFDRQETDDNTDKSAVQLFQENYGVPVRSVATLEDLVSFLRNHAESSTYFARMLKKILEYKDQYGVK